MSLQTFIRFRIGCLLASVFMTLVISVLLPHQSEFPAVGGLSWVAFFSLLVSAIVLGCLLTVTFASDAQLERWGGTMTGYATLWTSGNSALSPRTLLIVFLVAMASYSVLMARFVPLNYQLNTDQREYLILTEDMADSQREATLVQRMFEGDYREANRHPLYPALLALVVPHVDQEIRFLVSKCLSVAVGGVVLLLLAWSIARQFGVPVSAITTLLLATNFAFGHAASRISCEGLLMLWSVLLWLSCHRHLFSFPEVRGVYDGPVYKKSGWTGGIAIGVFAGLAYLTKASALLLCVGLIGTLCIPDFLMKKFGQKHAAGWKRIASVAGLCFLMVTSPLLVRNMTLYGSPFYNSNAAFLFTDNFSEALQRSDPSRSLEEIETTFQAARRYFSEHHPGEIMMRMARGVVYELFIFCRTLGPTPLGETRVFFGIFWLLLAGLGMWIEKRWDVLGVTWGFLFVVLFGWYVPIASGDRFLLPLMTPVYIYASQALLKILSSHIRDLRRAEGYIVCLIILWVLGCVGASLLSGSLVERFVSAT